MFVRVRSFYSAPTRVTMSDCIFPKKLFQGDLTKRPSLGENKVSPKETRKR